MQDSERRQIDSSYRVREFNVAHASLFAVGSRGAELIGMHSGVVTQIEQWAGKQAGAHLDWQEQTEQKNVAIKSLLDELRSMNLTARSINKQFPGMADQFKMPRSSDQNIVNTAFGFIEAATTIAEEFKKRGAKDSFLTDTQGRVEDVRAAEGRQASALASKTAATANLRAALKQERDIVRELNPIYHNLFRNDPGALASWNSARTIEAAPKQKKETPAPPKS